YLLRLALEQSAVTETLAAYRGEGSKPALQLPGRKTLQPQHPQRAAGDARKPGGPQQLWRILQPTWSRPMPWHLLGVINNKQPSTQLENPRKGLQRPTLEVTR